jgi:chemotaxis protein CheX
MDVRYINPFITAIQHVFKTMLKTDILISKPRLKEKDERSADVSSIIGLSGGATGSVVLCFPAKTAVAAASKFAGTTMTEDHPDFADALGELANMVSGQAKSKFHGVQVTISLPSVVRGSNHCVLKSQRMPAIVLPCDSELGRFSVEVAMVTNVPVEAPEPAAAGAAQA